MNKILLSSLSFLFGISLLAQNIDVAKYDLIIRISDSSDRIHVTEIIDFKIVNPAEKFGLDLVNVNGNGNGMKVSEAYLNDAKVEFTQLVEKIEFAIVSSLKSTIDNQLKLVFSGIPQDGLIIGKNKYGNRTFFGDNWPNRAHHWFACNDQPMDKALISMAIIAPSHYDIIANGEDRGQVNYGNGFTLHSYASKYELPTKVMVFGAADFSIDHLDEFKEFPMSSWVYPENEGAGFHDMKMAIPVMNYYEKNIAPYPYEKLANVQSTTRYGGMENAGCIFYAERSITGKDMMEELIAHEIAHQWFGNSATETDWSNLWLSEGFATYMTHLYIENKYGVERFKDELKKDRQTVIQFYNQHLLPLVDTISTDPIFMLNTNPYQRGSWVLHMLRAKIGDDLFWKSIQTYYDRYKYSNATTANFVDIVEEVSGQDLSGFENQWLRTGVIPELNMTWNQKKKNFSMTLKQVQKGKIFNLDLECLVYYTDGSEELITLQLKDAEVTMTQKITKTVKSIELDPNVKLLFRR